MNFLLKHLLNWFMFGGTMFFAAAAVADPGAAGGGDNGGNDSGQGNSGDGGNVSGDGVDPAGTGAGDDEAVQPGDADESHVGDDEAAKQTTDAKLDARTLPASVKTAMEGLQKTDPKAHAWLKDRLWAEKRFRDKVPGGMQEVEQMQGAITSLRQLVPPQLAAAPAQEIISAVQGELAEGRALDSLFDKGDPKLFEKMIEFSPDGFKKLLPSALAKYPDIDPEGYQRDAAAIVYGTLQGGNVLNTLGFVSRLLAKGDTAGAIEELKSVTEWANQVKQISEKKPAAAAQNPQIDQQKQQLDDREFRLWVNETATPINTAKSNAIKLELKQYLKTETFDDDTYQAFEDQTLRYLDALLKADPNFAPTFNSYIENRDRDGVTKYMNSKLKELLPSRNGKMGPVERAFKLFSKGTKPAQKAGQKPNAQGNQTRQQQLPPKGWEKIAAEKAPALHEIDRAKSPFEMIAKRAAILLNGKKVFWGDQAPA